MENFNVQANVWNNTSDEMTARVINTVKTIAGGHDRSCPWCNLDTHSMSIIAAADNNEFTRLLVGWVHNLRKMDYKETPISFTVGQFAHLAAAAATDWEREWIADPIELLRRVKLLLRVTSMDGLKLGKTVDMYMREPTSFESTPAQNHLVQAATLIVLTRISMDLLHPGVRMASDSRGNRSSYQAQVAVDLDTFDEVWYNEAKSFACYFARVLLMLPENIKED